MFDEATTFNYDISKGPIVLPRLSIFFRLNLAILNLLLLLLHAFIGLPLFSVAPLPPHRTMKHDFEFTSLAKGLSQCV